VKLEFFTTFALTLQTDFVTEWCFRFSTNEKFAHPCK